MTTYIALDIETTGVNPSIDQVLEVGAIAFSNRFQVVDSFNLVVEFDLQFALQKGWTIDPYVIDMHTKNGLWDACLASGLDERTVLHDLRNFLKRFPDARLFGRNVEGFDAWFIEQREPGTIKQSGISHRSLNLRSILLLSEFGVEMPAFKNHDKHRSIDDCVQDIEMLKLLVSNAGGNLS